MIPVSIPYIAKHQRDYVNQCLDDNWISAFGKFDKKLCEAFSNFIGTTFSSTCSNGTMALHLALLACGIKKNDEVILPDFNSPYALFACGYVGAKPVLVDIDKEGDVTEKIIKKAITKKTKAIIIPHLFGIPSRVMPILDICRDNKIFIIEDCAECHGAKEQDMKMGSIGDVGCFSFYANKILTSGEGGICTTSNENLFEKINYYKNQTFNSGPIKTFIHDEIGFNYRMSNIHCAIAYAQLEEVNYILEQRKIILEKYSQELEEYENSFQINKLNTKSVNWMTTFKLPSSKAYLRDSLEEYLLEQSIQTRRFFAPMNEQPIFNKMGGRIVGELNNSTEIAKSSIYLPTFIGITDQQISRVSDEIKNFLNSE